MSGRRRGTNLLGRPLREQPRALLALLGVVVVAAVVLAVSVGPRHPVAVSAPGRPVNPAPSPVITLRGRPAPPPTPALTAAELAAAQVTARTFLTSYLPVLYGRAPASSVRAVNAHVRASLRAANRPPRAPARRRPRVTQLTARPASANRVLMVATISDTVSAPSRIVFAVTRQRGGWRVSELANF